MDPMSFKEQHAEIWHLWAGSATDHEIHQTKNHPYTVGADLSDPGTDALMDQIRDALAKRAICALDFDYQRKSWKPVKSSENSRDFLFPGGLCVHMRRECGATIEDVECRVTEILASFNKGLKKGSDETRLSLSISDLEALLRP